MREISVNLSSKQEKAIMALLTESNMRQAAETAGVGESTLYRWLQEGEFNQAFKEARKKAFSQSLSCLQLAAATAVSTLKVIMENDEAPPSSRVTAAKAVIEMAHKAYELEDLSAELEEIKRFVEKS